ncbi:MAG TPA: aroma-sacti cluster domain-containing protein [Solirubrobacteraceae bacterium]|nr:aroma-sacti cluster domain-containing protein [Solirubrobacteraceae bacterium]
MDSERGENLQRLQDMNIVVGDDLPEEYRSVLDGLTPDEVDVLVAVKKRLDEAERVSGSTIGDNLIAP